MVLPASRKISRVPRYLGTLLTDKSFSPTGLSPSLVDPFQSPSINHLFFYCSTGPYSNLVETRNPCLATPYGLARNKFRLFPFRSPLLRESLLLSLPEGTEMFHFPSLALTHLWIQWEMYRHDSIRVAPFGYPRVYGCLHLPEAFRSLPRPSSPSCAKASIISP